MNIALLEDNPANLEYLVTLLQYKKHLTFPYTDATSFLDTMHTYSFGEVLSSLPRIIDLVILDLMLSGTLNGLDVLHRLRETDLPFADLPVIIVSAASQSLLDEVLRRFPTVPILRKPFHMQDLLTLVDAVNKSNETVSTE